MRAGPDSSSKWARPDSFAASAAEVMRVAASGGVADATRTETSAAEGTVAVDASTKVVFLAITVVFDTVRAGAEAVDAKESNAGADSGSFTVFGSDCGCCFHLRSKAGVADATSDGEVVLWILTMTVYGVDSGFGHCRLGAEVAWGYHRRTLLDPRSPSCSLVAT